jgi:hypothetical protein
VKRAERAEALVAVQKKWLEGKRGSECSFPESTRRN